MPEISELKIINISPENFLNACSPAELREVDLLIQSRRYTDKMSMSAMPYQDVTADGSDQEVTHQLMEAMKDA